MTVNELIKFLSQYDEDIEVELQYQDDGGYYTGSAPIHENECNIDNGILILA